MIIAGDEVGPERRDDLARGRRGGEPEHPARVARPEEKPRRAAGIHGQGGSLAALLGDDGLHPAVRPEGRVSDLARLLVVGRVRDPQRIEREGRLPGDHEPRQLRHRRPASRQPRVEQPSVAPVVREGVRCAVGRDRDGDDGRFPVEGLLRPLPRDRAHGVLPHESRPLAAIAHVGRACFVHRERRRLVAPQRRVRQIGLRQHEARKLRRPAQWACIRCLSRNAVEEPCHAATRPAVAARARPALTAGPRPAAAHRRVAAGRPGPAHRRVAARPRPRGGRGGRRPRATVPPLLPITESSPGVHAPVPTAINKAARARHRPPNASPLSIPGRVRSFTPVTRRSSFRADPSRRYKGGVASASPRRACSRASSSRAASSVSISRRSAGPRWPPSTWPACRPA